MPADKIEKWKAQLARFPDNELAHYSLATAYLEDGRFAEAEAHFAQALARKPDWVMACIHRAKCLLRLGRTAEAKALLLTGREHSIAQHHDAPVEEIDQILADLP